ncbi:MAG: hypothetical protein L0K89_00815, partial [Bifidobacterium crudilactis]|nr:hypothetical protein [Bifidobacterium crudilactis]
TYSTRDEAVNHLIVAAINAGDADAEDYDIDAIADATIEQHADVDENGVTRGEVWYAQREDVDADAFWAIVADHELN